MGVFQMIVAIVAIVVIGRIVQTRYAAMHRDRAPAEAEAARLREEIQSLRDRIAVLERIVTENDRGLTLDREIEALRTRD